MSLSRSQRTESRSSPASTCEREGNGRSERRRAREGSCGHAHVAGRSAPAHGDAVGAACIARRLGQQPVGIHEPQHTELAAADGQHVALHSSTQPVQLQAVQPPQGVARPHELRTALTDGFLMVVDIPERRRRVYASWRVSGERHRSARGSEGEQRLGGRRQLHTRAPVDSHLSVTVPSLFCLCAQLLSFSPMEISDPIGGLF